uniref:DNA repair protein n=1 Tax=uncultured delta proteobacterium TaxID=34034 RepID=Q2YZU2_9DELT|nr:DNA repair protein [uncultured delta proteobacterium]
MKKISDIPVNERPREKLLAKGAESLSDRELLAVIIGKGTQKDDVLSLSNKIIRIIDQKGIMVSADDLIQVDGIGLAKAALIASAIEFVRRRIRPEGLKIKFPTDILPLLRHYDDRKQEHFICISLNGANEVLNVRVITIGLVNKSQVHPREVFADVIVERASSIIIAHNHPSGSLTPSSEDRETTIRIKDAGNILGINLLDHIIFNNKGYYSFLENSAL